MSMHKSLKVNHFKKIRTVRKRYERIAKLKKEEKWVQKMSVYGLPKEQIKRITFKLKKKQKEEGEKLKEDLENPYAPKKNE